MGGGFFAVPPGTPGVLQIARWDGLFWHSVGGGITAGVSVDALATYDFGTGPRLYAGGGFSVMGGVPANGIASWDGSSWSALPGGGVTLGPFSPGFVKSLVVFNDGTGPALYVGGSFASAGGTPANSIARFDGVSWSALGSGVSGPTIGTVRAMAVFDDGNGPALFVGGSFLTAGGLVVNHLARWDGLNWTAVGGGVSATFGTARVNALAVFDDGSGPALHVGGIFDQAGAVPVSNIARWDGTVWSSLGSGVQGEVNALGAFDLGNGSELVVGGLFQSAGGMPISYIAGWDGSTWHDIPNGSTTPGLDGTVLALGSHDDGLGLQLFAGGWFQNPGGVSSPHVARLECPRPLAVSAMQPLGPGTSTYIRAGGLTPGNEYFILYGSSPCPGPPGSGPLLGLCAATPQDLQFLLLQLMNPLGSPAAHFIATNVDMSWGPILIPPLTVDALCLDVTGGLLSATSSVARMIIY